MAQFMDENQYAEDHNGGQNGDHLVNYSPFPGAIRPRAYSRAQWFTARTCSKVNRGLTSWAAMVSATTRGMPKKGSSPARKAATATSLAEFSTAGLAPPPRAAL